MRWIRLQGSLANRWLIVIDVLVKDIDYGFAGDVDAINETIINVLLQNNVTPVFCAITHDKNGQLLNTNADTIAASIARALASHYSVCLQYCFEKAGVLSDADDEQSVIPQINLNSYQTLKASGVIHSGMIPKLDNAFNALKAGVSEVVIGNLHLMYSLNNHDQEY